MAAVPSPFTLHAVRLWVVPAAVFVAACLDRGYQTDYWQHLARGRLVAREAAVVSADRFTFTAAGEPFRDNNWLTQLLYHALHGIGGLELVQVGNAAMLAATLALLVRLCRGASGSSGIAAVAGAVAFLGLWQTFLIRPQTVSMLLFVVLYAALTRAKERPSALLFVPPLMALWANVHGGFAVGLALIGTFALGEIVSSLSPEFRGEGTRRAPLFRLLACLLFSTVATFANPYGWDVYYYAGQLSAAGVGRGIEEWLPPTLGSLNGATWAASLVAVAALVARSWRQVTWTELCILCCFAFPSFISTRMTVWWFLAAAPVAARLTTVPVRKKSPEVVPSQNSLPGRPSVPAATALALLFAACALGLPWFDGVNPLLGTVRPGRRVEADLDAVAVSLRAPSAQSVGNPVARRLFTRMEWANYFAWACDGRVAVFIDGRVELYPPAVWDEYLTVSEARPGWDGVLERRRVDLLVLDRTYHGRLLDEIERSDRWTRRGRAGAAAVFERRHEPATPGQSVAGGADVGVGAAESDN